MKKNVYISGIIVLVVVVIGVGLGVLFYSFLGKEDIVNIEGIDFTLNDIKNEFLNTDYGKSNKCKGSIKDDNLIIKCNKEKLEFKVNGEFLEVSTDNDGLEIVSYVIDTIEHILGSNESYINTLDIYFTGKIYLNNIFMHYEDNVYNIGVSLSNLIDVYEDKEIVNNDEVIDIDKSDYEIDLGDYVVSGVNFASDKDSLIYVIAGTIFNQDKKYNKKITVVYYDNLNNIITEDTVSMNDFDKYNSYLSFSIVSNIKDENSFDKICKFTLKLE